MDDLENFNKPYAWVIVPTILHEDADSKEHIGQLITELRDYGFNSSEDIISSTIVNGIPELDELDGLNDLMRRIPQAGELIQDLEADFEAEEEANLSKLDLFNKYKNEI